MTDKYFLWLHLEFVWMLLAFVVGGTLLDIFSSLIMRAMRLKRKTPPAVRQSDGT